MDDGRLHLLHTGDHELYDGLVRSVAAEIFAGWADADEVPRADILRTLFTMLEEEGVTC